MTSTIKVNNIQNQCGANIINESSNTITLGASGDTIALASGASQTGFGRTGTVDWNTTPKTSTFTAVSGDGFFANTSGGAFSMNLPAGSAGAIVSVADYAATWQTNNLTVVPNGSDKIGSLNQNATLDVKGQSVTFVFVDSTQGWINTMDSTSNVRGNPPFICASVSGACNTLVTAPCCSSAKIATFTGPGTFTVNSASPCAANNVVSYLVVAGAGSGGSSNNGNMGAPGGAGGFREVKSPVTPYTASPLDGYPSAPNRVTVSATAFPITVGAGGATVSGATLGNSGSNSIFSSITSAGGGGGGSGNPVTAGVAGGSGGGGAGGGSGVAGGAGNTPPVSPSQGNNGGGSRPGPGPSYDSSSGGGGGAGGVGGPSPDGNTAGAGGAHINTTINSNDVEYAGGAGGTAGCTPGCRGTPGGGGAGNGSKPGGANAATPGTANTGGSGGGGGQSNPASGAGGSGVVIIRYKFQ